MELTIRVEQVSGTRDSGLLVLRGAVCSHESDELQTDIQRQLLEGQLKQGVRRLLVDMEQVERIEPGVSFVSLLGDLTRRLEPLGGGVALLRLPDPVRLHRWTPDLWGRFILASDVPQALTLLAPSPPRVVGRPSIERGFWELVCSGSLGFALIRKAHRSLSQLVAHTPRGVLVDLRSVTWDPRRADLADLLLWLDDLERHVGRVVLVVPGPGPLRQALERAAPGSSCRLAADLSSARAALGRW